MTNIQNRVNFTREAHSVIDYRSGPISYLPAGVVAGAVLVGAAPLLQAALWWRRCPILRCFVVVVVAVLEVVVVVGAVPAGSAAKTGAELKTTASVPITCKLRSIITPKHMRLAILSTEVTSNEGSWFPVNAVLDRLTNSCSLS